MRIFSAWALENCPSGPACCGLYKQEKQCISEKRTMQTAVKLPLLVVALAIVAKAQWICIPRSPILGALIHTSANVNYVWGVNEENEIYMCRRPCNGEWNRMDGALKQLDVDDHEVWGVNRGDEILKRPVDGSDHWQVVKGSLKHVSASGYGYVWGVNRTDGIYKCKKPCSGDWVSVPGDLKQIDGGQRNVYGVNSANNISTSPVDGSGVWRSVSGSLNHISASGRDEVFGVNNRDEIFRCKKPCFGGFERMSGHFVQCDATVDAVFAVDRAGAICRHDIPIE